MSTRCGAVPPLPRARLCARSYSALAPFAPAAHSHRPSLKENGEKPCFGQRYLRADGTWTGFEFRSFAGVRRDVAHLAAGLRQLGLTTKERIGVYAKNCCEYGTTFLAALQANLVLVPLYDTLGPDACAYVINHAELSTVVCSAENVPRVRYCAARLMSHAASFSPLPKSARPCAASSA